MNRLPVITELDISRPARALSWLRLTDYVLVVMCGALAVSNLSELVINFPVDDPAMVIILSISTLFAGFAAYTGWRHVGVIEPAVWKIYSVLFPIFTVVCLLLAAILLFEYGSFSGLMESNFADTVGLLGIFYLGCVTLVGWTALMLLQRIKIIGMGATVGQILTLLKKKSGFPAKKATEIKRINKPRGLVIGAAGLLVLVAVILVPMPDDEKISRIILKNIEQIKWLGFFLLVRARRYFQIDADSLLAADQRPPILFLRSFDDDEKQRFTRSDKAFLDFSLETRLSNHFSRFGPFIAIGSPKEAVPQLGASRVLLSDDEWQPRVLSWMREAGLIIMYSGKTHWVNWELRQIVENDCATRLILMFPEIKAWRSTKRNAEISARVEQVRQVFKNTPWEEELLEFNDFPGLRAMLFRPDGSVVIVSSRSRSRDSYHLAALIAHQYLLDPDSAALAVVVDEKAPRLRRSVPAFAAIVAAIGAVLGAVYLFSEREDSRLAFKQGELYFSEPVTEKEARRVGEYLVQQQIFSDEHANTVQLHQEQGKYRLRFVIGPEYVEDPLTAIQFGIIGTQVAEDALGGKPIEVGLYDDQLKLIKVVPLSASMIFGRGELYYTEPVSRDEARRVGEYLVRQQFYSDDQESTVQLLHAEERYHLRFVINPEYTEDPITAIEFGMLGRQIANDVLSGKPVEVGFTDNRLKLIRVVPSSAVIAFGKGELYYSEPVTAAEASIVGKRLRQSGYFSDDQPAAVYIMHEDGAFQLKFMIDPSRATDPDVRLAFVNLTRDIIGEALGERPLVLHLCDGNFTTLHSERM